MKIRTKTLNTVRMLTAGYVDVTIKPSFSEDENG